MIEIWILYIQITRKAVFQNFEKFENFLKSWQNLKYLENEKSF